MKLIKLLFTYLKNRQEINQGYSYGVKNGYYSGDDNWLGRTELWLKNIYA